ncbi:MAG: hypothetical protein ACRYFY_14995 [Janthinobacterium lividum]
MDGLDIIAAEGVAGLLRRPVSEHRHSARRSRVKPWLPFLIFVMLPTLVAAIYFLGFASPQYVSEAKFVVRGQANAPTGMLSSLLMPGGSSASEDTYAVQDYMMSRDAAALLARTQGLRQVFDRHDADALARFPTPFFGKTFEHFYKYYQTHIDAELDTTTSISTLTVRTFRPQDSQRIAVALLGASEQLINRMNQRQRDNLISSGTQEVAAAEDRLRRIAVLLATYRNREALLDPMKQSVPMLRDISDLQTMLTTTRLQVEQLRASAPSSPLIQVYERRASAIEAQIVQSNSGITGSGQSLVPKITAYDDLTLQQEFAQKQLANAISTLELARNQADRQLLYLDQITEPNLPDYASYPKRFASIAVIFASLLGAYLMLRLLISGAREHKIV